MNKAEKTSWSLYECDGGARWSACHPVFRDPDRGRCNFSGCNCGGWYRKMMETDDHEVAANWFRRPEVKEAK